MEHTFVRKRLRRTEGRAYARFLTFSCFRRLPLFLNDRIKQEFVDVMACARREYGFLLIAWVIMPEHVHLLIRPRPSGHPVPRLLMAIKQPFAQRVIARWRRLDAPVLRRIVDAGGTHFWLPGGGYDRNTYSEREFAEKIEYIHWNPVRRGLVESPTDWHWSSARWYAGQRDGALAVDGRKFERVGK